MTVHYGSRVTSINCVCQRNSKEKKILRFCPSRKFPGAKEAVMWKNPAVVLSLPLLFWPEWEVLVYRAMWGLDHWSRSSLFSFISSWCRWYVNQPNERATVLFDSLMKTKHSHKVMEKRGEDSLEQNIYLLCYSWLLLISDFLIWTVDQYWHKKFNRQKRLLWE